MSETYNGWHGYSTWRVNLEIFDGMSASDFGVNHSRDLPEALKDYVEEILESQGSGLVLSYALAFISDVDWNEIARHMQEE